MLNEYGGYQIYQMNGSKWLKRFAATVAAVFLCITPVMGESAKADTDKPIVLRTMGSLFFGGTVTQKANGETFHGEAILPHDGYTIDQFMRQQTCDTGELPLTTEHRRFMGNTMKALLEETGSAILLTHSYGGQFGWETATLAPELIKDIVAYEPGQHVFPEGDEIEDVFTPLPDVAKNLAPQIISEAETQH